MRMLRRNSGFFLLASLCLILAIGANSSVLSWVEGILLRPRPLVAHQERLMAIAGDDRGTPGHTDVSWPDFRDLQENCALCDTFMVDRITATAQHRRSRRALSGQSCFRQFTSTLWEFVLSLAAG